MNNLFTIHRKGDAKTGRIIWTQDQISYIINEYNKNHRTTILAKQFQVSVESIRALLRKNNIKLLSLSELRQLNYPRNSNFFNMIDTPQKAYWLGFLYADGYITKDNGIRINLSKEDENHLKKFILAIEYINDNAIKYSKKIDNDKIYHQAYLGIKDKTMVQDLADKGCVNNKSLILEFPFEKIPIELYSHFIRGYFDGDGCLTSFLSGKAKTPNWKIVFVGTEKFLTAIKQILGKEKLALEHRGNYCMLHICGNKQLKKILAYIYKDSYDLIELTRKRQKYEQFLLQSLGSEPIKIGCE